MIYEAYVSYRYLLYQRFEFLSRLFAIAIKVAVDRFRSSVCIYEKSTHEVRRLIPKMREIFTNRFRNVSAIIVRAKSSLVKYTILQRIVLSA